MKRVYRTSVWRRRKLRASAAASRGPCSRLLTVREPLEHACRARELGGFGADYLAALLEELRNFLGEVVGGAQVFAEETHPAVHVAVKQHLAVVAGKFDVHFDVCGP